MNCPACSQQVPAGLAACPQCAAPLASIPTPNAVIRLKRTGRFTAIWTRFEVYLDDQPVGVLRNQEEVRYEVSPGQHTLYIQLDAFKSKKGVLELAPGETIDLVCSPRAFGAGVKLDVAPPGEAEGHA